MILPIPESKCVVCGLGLDLVSTKIGWLCDGTYSNDCYGKYVNILEESNKSDHWKIIEWIKEK